MTTTTDTHPSWGPVTSSTPDTALPLVLQPAEDGVDLFAWAAEHRTPLEQALERHGAILFRGFIPGSIENLDRFVQAVGGDPMEDRTEVTSPRTELAEHVYTSTDHPADQTIPLHNENSYALGFPRRLFFHCLVPPQEGGETPLADVRRVLRRIDPEVRRGFEERGYRYTRNFWKGIGIPWERVFQTSDAGEVAAYCREHGIEHEWLADGRLRTHHARRVLARHPATGEECWFNHLTFFHILSMEERYREAILAVLPEADLPNNTYYGDGEPIEPAVIRHLQDAYRAETVQFPWQAGDLLMVDNLLAAHGRRPFRGPRQILVAMADPCRWDDV